MEDAYRRDLTINSLFYNLNTGTVEDFTMRGISDLQARLVRTPLPAVETFREDPLRLLRAVRFATRFDCSIDPSIFAAARIPEIERFLSVKVSRERIGIEFLKMAQFRHFDRALHELSNMDILNSLDTTGIEPLSHVFDITNVMREDRVGKSNTKEEILRNMPETEDDMPVVPRTID